MSMKYETQSSSDLQKWYIDWLKENNVRESDVQFYIVNLLTALIGTMGQNHKEDLKTAYTDGVSEGMSQSSSFEWGTKRKDGSFEKWFEDFEPTQSIGLPKDEYDTIPPQFVGDHSRKIKRVTATTYPKEKYFAVEYAGFWNIQEGQYYGDVNILDAEKVGEDIAESNAKLIAKLLNTHYNHPPDQSIHRAIDPYIKEVIIASIADNLYNIRSSGGEQPMLDTGKCDEIAEFIYNDLKPHFSGQSTGLREGEATELLKKLVTAVKDNWRVDLHIQLAEHFLNQSTPLP